MRIPPDPIAENKFLEENNARNDWQGKASVELVLWAFELGVLYPPDRKAGRLAALVDDALIALKKSKEANSSQSDAYAAGMAVGAVAERLHTMRQARRGTLARKGNEKKDTGAFMELATRYVASGKGVSAAHRAAKTFLVKYAKAHSLPAFQIPSQEGFRMEYQRRKTRGA